MNTSNSQMFTNVLNLFFVNPKLLYTFVSGNYKI